jgi:hypothetical protein
MLPNLWLAESLLEIPLFCPKDLEDVQPGGYLSEEPGQTLAFGGFKGSKQRQQNEREQEQICQIP